MRRLLHTTILLLALCASVHVPLYATVQHPSIERGYQTEKSFQIGDLDDVNLFNGNLVLSLPIGPQYSAGGNLSYQLTLRYNSKLWDWEIHCRKGGSPCAQLGRANQDSNAGFGWQLSLGRLISPHTPPRNASPRWMYLSADGAEHLFYDTLHQGESPTSNVFYSRDGSYLRLKRVGVQWQIEEPNGTKHRFGPDPTAEKSWRLTRITDTFGNYLEVSYPNALQWNLRDSTGRRHEVRFQRFNYDEARNPQPRPMVTEVKLASFGNSTARYTLAYDSRDVARPCPHLDFPHPDNQLPARATVPLLTRVTQPDGSAYSMATGSTPQYHLSQTSFACQIPGALKQMRLPTLGYLAWEYGVYQFATGESLNPDDDGPPYPHEPQHFLNATLGVEARIVRDARNREIGRWRYDQELEIPATWPERLPVEARTTVTSPLTDYQTVHYFSAYPLGPASHPAASRHHYGLPFTVRHKKAGLYLSRRVLERGQQVRSTYVGYEHDRSAGDDSFGSVLNLNRRMHAERTQYHYDGSRFTSMSLSDFDGLGHYRRMDSGGNLGPGNRATYTRYNPDVGTYTAGSGSGFSMLAPDAPWVLGTYKEQWESEGSTAYRQYCFDPITGFLKRARTLAGGSRSRDDVIVDYTPTPQGQVARERYYGGDTQTVSQAANLCSLGLPASAAYGLVHAYQFGTLKSSRYENTNHFLVERGIDRDTGLVAWSRDSAGLQSDYSYDNLGRLTLVKPAVGHGGRTRYDYYAATAVNNLARVEIKHLTNAGGSSLAQNRIRFDGLGRVWKEERLMPGGVWASQSTLYNAFGWKTDVTGYGGGTTRYLDYDLFGRARRIRPPDGQAHDVRLSYTGIRLVNRTVKIGTSTNGETSFTTTEEYDRQGRLYKVTEPPGGLHAVYSYDVGNRLRHVWLRPTGGGPSQHRYFTYDNRGFLLSSQHPEKGPGTVLYRDYDARGHAGRQTDVPNDLRLTYDPAERLTEVREHGGAGRLLKEFRYATSNAAGNNLRKGKLWQAVRHNWVRIPWVPGGPVTDVTVTETYTYRGRDGRVSQRDTAASGNQSFTQSWAYDELGNVASQTYPRCTFHPCNATTKPNTTIHRSYTQGYLTAVPGYANLIQYHRNGLVKEVRHSNGLREHIATDPSGIPRPSVIYTSGTFNGSLGLHKYDGAGNLVRRDQEHYLYDGQSRLTRYTTSAGTHQGYTYDPYGNLKRIDYFNGTSTITRTMGVNTASNRLTGAVGYDGAGNLTGWGPRVYTYDAFNMQQAQDFPAETYLYTADDERLWTLSYTAGQPIREIWTLRGLDHKVLRRYENEGGSNGTWTWLADYIHRGTALLAADTSEAWPENRQHYLTDHLGTPRLVTGTNGTPLRVHHYFGFGEETPSSAGGLEPMRFTGHERDFHKAGTVDDLDYMHARYYSSHLGRFLSVDPSMASAKPGAPQSWNRYAYGANNPVKFVDPDGQESSAAITQDQDIRGLVNGEITTQQFRERRNARGAPVVAAASLFVPGPEDVALAVVASAKVGRAFGSVGRFFSRILGRADDVPAGTPRVHMGKQGKHIPGHNNYRKGRSVLRADPEALAAKAGTGEPVGRIPRGQAGFKERVDFGEAIGDFVEEGVATPTTKGIITYAADGTIHIIPVRP